VRKNTAPGPLSAVPVRGNPLTYTTEGKSQNGLLFSERVFIKPARFAELPLASEAIKLAHFKFGPGGQRERNGMQDLYG
jgi:hypothetical protein